MSTKHHTVIVGGGTAGCVVASRLSRDPNRRITLIEAGSASQHASGDVRRGSMLLAAVPNHPATWTYDVELRPGHQHQLTRGRLMGGSMAINGGYFVRATPADFEEWSRYGGPAWSYKQVMGPLRRLENDHDYPHSDLHGQEGPIQIARAPGGEVYDAFQAAAHSLGFSAEADKNAAAPPGFGPIPSTVIDGDRRSSADGYLTPLPPHVTVVTDSRVRRITVETQGDRNATIRGVETSRGPISSDDVIVAAGAIETARLLMVSGIGPADDLRDQGIDVVQDLPVGVD
ncbi:MAG TPA: GMC family oxidoreductase N-terminal domain-containing protein, partial [Beutenbergiaceae bacterium]|nr:GMC family oxidoreductase N-terminal domain-containing protein [Beutenbergiaceae bacterium]